MSMWQLLIFPPANLLTRPINNFVHEVCASLLCVAQTSCCPSQGASILPEFGWNTCTHGKENKQAHCSEGRGVGHAPDRTAPPAEGCCSVLAKRPARPFLRAPCGTLQPPPTNQPVSPSLLLWAGERMAEPAAMCYDAACKRAGGGRRGNLGPPLPSSQQQPKATFFFPHEK